MQKEKGVPASMKVIASLLAACLMVFASAGDAEAAKAKKRYRFKTSWSQGYQTGWAQDRINQAFGRLDGKNANQHDFGFGITVYVIDTASESEDCNGHGTFVSSLINDDDFGVASGATVVRVKALDCNGFGTAENVLSAINFVKNNADYTTSIANMSLGGPINESIDLAINELADVMPVVVSAGNDGSNACSYSPARAVNAITVASFDIYNMRSLFSNHGPCVDMWAPGTSVDGKWSDGTDRQASGTSAATPLVSGAIAHIASRDSINTLDAAQKLFNESSNLPIIDGRCLKRCIVLWLRQEPYDWLRSDSPSWRP